MSQRYEGRYEKAAIGLLEAALAQGEPAFLQPKGDCMEPLIRSGDRIELTAGEPFVGAICLLRDPSGQLACHRVLAVSDASLTTAGDRSGWAREHPRSEVLALVRAIHRGRATLSLESRWIRSLGRWEAACHPWQQARRSAWGRWPARLFRRLTRWGYRFAWLGKEATSRLSSGTASPACGPAASR